MVFSVDGVAIDWTVSDSSASSEGSSAPSINWDVTDGDAPNIEIVDAAEVGIGEFGDMNAEKKANEKERETILSSNETRRTLLSELLELEVFFFLLLFLSFFSNLFISLTILLVLFLADISLSAVSGNESERHVVGE